MYNPVGTNLGKDTVTAASARGLPVFETDRVVFGAVWPAQQFVPGMALRQGEQYHDPYARPWLRRLSGRGAPATLLAGR